MQPVLLDSSIYISVLRHAGDVSPAVQQFTGGASVWLSAVVLEELYAGARARDSQVVEILERDFRRSQRIVVPTLYDWAVTGKVLARLAAHYGYEHIGRGRLTNDALIALSAGRLGIRVITANESDFRRLAEFCSFPWQVVAS